MASSRLRDPGFLPGSSSLSFKEALSGSSSISMVFPELKVSSFRGMPSLWISEMEIEALAAPFEFALVGKFPARHPSLDAIRKFFFNLKLKGDVSVTVLNKRNVLIKLFNDLDYCRVFTHRSYFVNNCFMKLIKWSPTLDVETESPVVPIWISFPNLRPHLFASRILHGLGRVFDNPLKTDNATSTGSRPSVARVLVELDVSKTFPDKIWIGPENSGYVQSVVLEDFPEYCGHCSSLGHSKAGCTILHPNIEDFSAIDLVQELVSVSVNVETIFDGSPVLGVVEDLDRPRVSVMNEEPNLCVQTIISDVDISMNLVNVPVTVGASTGLNVRSHGDWLYFSSEYESDSESYSDPGFELNLVRDRPVTVCPRGKLWKRGGRKR
ncbi:hypothetical protein MA16_Dca004953 [Dendrobium catenatum]|uniref:DUF4283 domain-containing protein n=1 Tax=Dendrobium catenatum TaxID=906689 RepID=A0A2I0WGJ3_9ASPA|nr:hypothetical protein MA16_Dca004953 [Dendrobium catenatum]